MCRNMKQHGFSLIMAIFLIVVLSGIAVFFGRVATMQHQSSALDEEGATAYQAARAGIEWGVYQAIRVPGYCVPSPDSDSFTLAIPATPTSTVNYTVTVACTLTIPTEGSNNVNVFQITATAINASVGRFFVERRLTATITQ